MDTDELFSKSAWMAFVAHLAVALVIITPAVYAGAEYVAQKEAAEAAGNAVSKVTESIATHREEELQSLAELRIKQQGFATDIEAIKLRLARIEQGTDRIDDKLDLLLSKQK